MRVAIAGIGVAGSYLASRLKREHEVVGFERMRADRHDSICAWGTCRPKMEELCALSGVDFAKYVTHDGRRMHVEVDGQEKFHIGLDGLCTYDKIGLIRDLVDGCEIRYGAAPTRSDLERDFDVIVDCTGFHRSYLPKIKNDFYLPTYEHKVEYENGVPFDDFYIRPFRGMSGYFWYFPLGKNSAHIGAGDYQKAHVRETGEFMKRHGGKITKTVGRPIRLATPNMCMPYSDGKVVGVGESIGTVFPLLGEGIIPSMVCADIFTRNIGNVPAYEREVREHFEVYAKVFRFVHAKLMGRFSMLRQGLDMLSIYRYMKKNEARFGMDIEMRNLIKVARA